MESLENSEPVISSALPGDANIVHDTPKVQGAASDKAEKLARHDPVENLEKPPSKRMKPGLSESNELNPLGSSPQSEAGALKNERQKGVAPIKAELVVSPPCSY